MKDLLINTTLFITAMIVIVGATWYVSPDNDDIDYTEEKKLLSEREIIDYIIDTDIFSSIVNYAYTGERLPEKLADNELVEMRTENSYTKQVGILNEGEENEEVILELVSYSDQVFIKKDDNNWYYLENATVPKNIFDASATNNLFGVLLGNIAYAASATIYSASGDGRVFRLNETTWNGVHDATFGSGVSNGTVGSSVRVQGIPGLDKVPSTYAIYRAFLPFDTSAIPSSATSIDSATLNIYVTATTNGDNDGLDYITIIRTDQTTHTTLATSDYNNAGATDDPTEGISTGQRKDITGISTSAYLSFTLNSTGLSWIEKSGDSSVCSASTGISCFGIREGHDTTDVAITLPPIISAINEVAFSNSEETGTSQDPYLSVTYTVPSSFAPWMFHAF